MSKSRTANWMMKAVVLNSKECRRRFRKYRAQGAKWMIECQDLWDFEDDDAGVYFVSERSARGVSAVLKELRSDTDRVLGIYDLTKPLAGQGAGISREEWKKVRRCLNRR